MSKSLDTNEPEPTDEQPAVDVLIDDMPEPRDINRPRLLRYPFGESPIERGLPEAWK